MTRIDTVVPLRADVPEVVSPSLLTPIAGAPSFELKFLLSDALAEQVEAWSRQHLAFDPHADAALGNAYRIHSLYLDTVALDVYHRAPKYGRRKFRIRRYGTERGLYLERKTRSGDRVAKRRTFLPDTELLHLQNGHMDSAWAGHWFHRRLVARRLQPVCQITYDRVAHVGASAEGPLRLTLDRHVSCAPVRDWQVGEVHHGLALFQGQIVLELKYRSASLPVLFKRLLGEFKLCPRPASKYRRAIEAWGLAGHAKEVG